MWIETYTELSKALPNAKMCYEQLPVEEIDKEMLAPFVCLIQACEHVFEEEMTRREKQRIGIQKAQQNGVHSGRPAIRCSKKLLKLAYMKSKNKITATYAAERLHISLSTYYKLRTKYRKELEQWKKQAVCAYF